MASSAALVTHYNPNKYDFSSYTRKLHKVTNMLSEEDKKEVYPEGLRGLR